MYDKQGATLIHVLKTAIYWEWFDMTHLMMTMCMNRPPGN